MFEGGNQSCADHGIARGKRSSVQASLGAFAPRAPVKRRFGARNLVLRIDAPLRCLIQRLLQLL